MADKAISELIAANQVTPTDLFVLEQSGTAKKLTGQTLENWLLSFADGHGGIQSIVKQSTSGLKDTYRITLADTTTVDFVVTNGKSISSVQQTKESGLTRTYTIAFNDGTKQTFTVTDGRSITKIEKTGTSGLTDTYTISYNDNSTSTFTVKNGKSISSIAKTSTSGLVDTYRITYNDNSTSTFTVTNGAKGDPGENAYIWVKYASKQPTASAPSIGDIPDEWIGIYTGTADRAPTSYASYKWYKIRGEKGETGDPATLTSYKVEYQVSSSGTVVPSGSWKTSVPVVAQGQYLWTRTTNTFNTGSPVVSYSVTRMGLDGSGSVASVANVSPDDNGNVPLTAEHINALSTAGGTMTGSIDMNGQKITGLNDPTDNTDVATKGYTLGLVNKAAPYNLLDNSDFRNPVNQRGQTSYTGVDNKEKPHPDTYTIDRWRIYRASRKITVENGYIRISTGSGTATGMLRQYIKVDPAMRGKTVTFAAKVKGVDVRVNLNDIEWSLYTSNEEWETLVTTYTIPDDAEYIFAAIQVRNKADILCEWAALYEGEYTAETLPEYHRKGYAAELLECQRYYLAFGDMTFRSTISENPIHNITITFPVPMRVVPNVTATAIEGEVPAANIKQNGIAYSAYGEKYTLRYVTADADYPTIM